MYRILALGVILGAYQHQNIYRTSNILDKADHILLITSHATLISVLIGGWVMQLLFNILMGVQVSTLIVICSYSRQHGTGHQLKLYLIGVGYLVAWSILKCYASQVWTYGIGERVPEIDMVFEGVIATLGGWNCKFIQFTVAPLLWLICSVLAYVTGRRIIKAQDQLDHSWKQQMMKRKILPDALCTLVLFVFNLAAYIGSDGVKECCIYWFGRTHQEALLIQAVKTISYIVPALNTYWFYYRIIPQFQRRDPDQHLTQPLHT